MAFKNTGGLTLPASRSLPDRIADALTSAIWSGQFAPGSQIVESRVAKQIGIGQNAVREALQALEFQGLVTKIPNKGTFVTQLSREDVNRIFNVLEELESLAVGWARRTGRPTPADRESLFQQLQTMQQGADHNKFEIFSRADLAFHRQIWEMSSNQYLVRALEVVAPPLFAYVLVKSVTRSGLELAAVVQEHRDWLEVLTSQDEKECIAYTRRMMHSFRMQILDRVETSAIAETGGLSLSAAGTSDPVSP